MEGIVNVLKPPGMTSSDVVTDIRRIFSIKRVGHTGTLDPGASGVLPICLGRATRLFDILMDKEKEYIAELAIGAATDTEDAYGAVAARSDAKVSREALLAVLPRFLGGQEQLAPLYSAVNVGGRKMYDIARSGGEAERKRRTITVTELELLGETGPGRFLLRMVCSKGTYVRTLCTDIAEAAGAKGYMSFLLRTRSGAFVIDGAYTLDELRALREADRLSEAVVSIERTLCALGEARFTGLNSAQRRLLMNGAYVPAPEGAAEGVPLRAYMDGEFIGIAETKNGSAHIKLYFAEEHHDGE